MYQLFERDVMDDLFLGEEAIDEAHRKGKRRSTRGKHQKGQRRTQMDRGREKADPQRQLPRKRPKNWKGPWPPPNAFDFEDDLFYDHTENIERYLPMYDTFEADVMDDLFYEAEGPSRMRRRNGGAFDEYDSYDAYDEFDAYDAYDAYDEGDALDAMEDAMAYALGAEDSDEFLRRLVRGARQVAGRVAGAARSAGRVVGQVARTVAPLASMIPHPAAQAIGRVAQVAGRLLADGADDFEAFEALVDLADAEDLMDAAVPAIATTAVHAAMPQAARLPQATRQQLVRATAQTAQTLAQQQGTQAVRALPALVQAAQRTARQQGLPPRALPSLISRIGQRLSHNPQMLRRLLRSASPALRQQICAACGQPQGRPAARRV